jgi:branched-chain amino acid transport system ATP-binding protein
METSTPLLRVRGLSVRYGQASPVLKRIDLDVARGGVTCLLGSNGAGKTTLMRALSATLFLHGGRISEGQIDFDGERIDHRDGAAIVRRGLVQSPEGRRVFPDMSVNDNLLAGATSVRSKQAVEDGLTTAYDLFPVLRERREQHAGTLSGGEQQMLAIGRALMSSPTLLLLDEPSLGLAPKIVDQVADVTRDIASRGTTVLLVEQNAAMALGVADHAAVMELGTIVDSGPAAKYRDPEVISRIYLGETPADDVAVLAAADRKTLTLERWVR